MLKENSKGRLLNSFYIIFISFGEAIVPDNSWLLKFASNLRHKNLLEIINITGELSCFVQELHSQVTFFYNLWSILLQVRSLLLLLMSRWRNRVVIGLTQEWHNSFIPDDEVAAKEARLSSITTVRKPLVILLYPDITAESEGDINKKRKRLDLRSTMSSPRSGILSLIRFNSGQD